MWILIARHGKAEEKKVDQPDEARRLTAEGRKDVEMVAKLLPIKPSVVYSSPLKRAIETAEIIAKVWNIEVRIIDELRPELTSLERLKSIEVLDRMLLVGHAPSIEDLLSELIGGGRIALKAGAIAGLEAEEFKRNKAVLRFLIIPNIAKLCFQ